MPKQNWVDEVGGLPHYIKQIADDLVKNGHSQSSAIAIAVSRIKAWVATGSPETKAKAAAALAEWEAKKAKAHAKRGITVNGYEQRDGLTGTVKPVENADGRHLFAARVVNYGPVDDHGTTWAPGVFAESLREKKPTAVWSHKWDRPIGRVSDYRDTPEGLDVIVELANFEAVPDARMAHSLLKDGVIDSFSFGFAREDEEPDPDHRGATRITKATLAEISPVLVASGKGTRTLGVRSTPRAEATELLSRVADGEIDAQTALTLLAEMRETPAVEVRCAPEQREEMRALYEGWEIEDTEYGFRAQKDNNEPHKYVPASGEGSVCKTCGGKKGIKNHTDTADTAGPDQQRQAELRALDAMFEIR